VNETTETIPDSYQAYVEARRKAAAENPEPDPFVTVRLMRGDVNMLLDLMAAHVRAYGPKTQEAGVRCANALVASLRVEP
jgi:hypothetical protein